MKMNTRNNLMQGRMIMRSERAVRPELWQRGFTLIELLVAIALGIFLTWGVIEAFMSGKRAYSLQQSLSRIQ